MSKIDLDLEAHAVIGAKLAPRTAVLDANRLGNANVAALDAEDTRPTCSIASMNGIELPSDDRHFGAVDFDDDVVEAKRVDAAITCSTVATERAEKPRTVHRSVLPTWEETAQAR